MALQFLENPGVRERHLLRQYHNPLFPESKREFDEQRLDGARFMDQKDQEQFFIDFQQIVEQVSQLKENESSETMLELKARLDHIYEQCCGLGGQYDNEKQAIAQLVAIIMAAIRKGAQGDAEAQMNLDEEQLARQTHYQLLEFPIVADLLRPQSPIKEDELVPTLLSESTQALTAAFNLFDKEQQQSLYQQAENMMKELQPQITASDVAWQRLALMQQLQEG